jgi:hypothetical protein
VLRKFARNYAFITGALVPSFYQLVVAARGAADDNFAYEIWDKGSQYPWQSEKPELPVLRLSGEDLFLDQKRIRFHRRLKTFRRRLVSVPVIAVPTSVGYGANFGGISALLAMLTSCSSGVTVVNIDNGFGAGFSASMINQMK